MRGARWMAPLERVESTTPFVGAFTDEIAALMRCVSDGYRSDRPPLSGSPEEVCHSTCAGVAGFSGVLPPNQCVSAGVAASFFRFSGHYQVDGVGYATIQDVLLGGLATAPFLALLFASKLTATSLSLGSGSSGGIFSPSLYMGATLGGAFGAIAHYYFPMSDLSVPAFAMVGMAAMVGGATGAAMTAVTMIFEMTLDYGIVMPMIIAVAISIGCRRVLSRENIYTIKLVARRHFIPKALHANMFLVRRAEDVMDKEVIVLRVNTALRRGLEGAYTGVSLGDVASRDFTIARSQDVMFAVIGRMWRRKSTMAVVVQGEGRIPRTKDIIGVISKEHVADSVAESIKNYAVSDAHL